MVAKVDAGSATTENGHKNRTGVLALGALGVVFGDIGTSPLYAMQECFTHGLEPVAENILGVTSLIFWAVMIVVTIKYVFIVMRANNRGEGGILALMSLASSGARKRGAMGKAVAIVGMCGASLFFGDSIITPAISVLSAVEGIKVVDPEAGDLVLPVSIGILFALFLFQKHGTQKVGNYFGPIMVVWFTVLAVLGGRQIAENPQILAAANPFYALQLISNHGTLALIILGAALLAFTGAEALYADMGHFGIRPIRYAWLGLVMPSLAINYFGQGALLLADPAAAHNPFYMLAPENLRMPMIGLAAAATIIASQAVISGTFSVVKQAMQMDYLPRFEVQHTSEHERGQIYIPQINWLLCAGVLFLVLMFRSSGALAEAYGFAVAGSMLVDTLLVYSVARAVWHWPFPVAIGVFGMFLAIDIAFFTAATIKIPDGGWLPLIIGVGIFTVFLTWREGREIVRSVRRSRGRKMSSFLDTLTPERPVRVAGTAVYLSSVRSFMPQAMISNLHHNRVLHQRVIVLTIVTEEDPRIEEAARVNYESIGEGIWQATLHYGFMEIPNVMRDLAKHLPKECRVDPKTISFFIGRDKFVEGSHPLRPRWREKLFLWLSNHATEAFEYFRIPAARVVELGVQIKV